MVLDGLFCCRVIPQQLLLDIICVTLFCTAVKKSILESTKVASPWWGPTPEHPVPYDTTWAPQSCSA